MDVRNIIIYIIGLLLGLGTAFLITQMDSEPTQSHSAVPADEKECLKIRLSPDAIVPNSTAICLLTIDHMDERDERPACGLLYDVLYFKTHTGIGDSPEKFSFARDYGGIQMAGEGVHEGPSNPFAGINREMLTVGNQYYFVFGDHENVKQLPPGLIGWWRADSEHVPENIKAALENLASKQ